METHPPLADQLAGLRAIPTTPKADTTILSAALHALVAAIFARIFGRLEQFLLLWQSGSLPCPPTICPTHHAQCPAPNRRLGAAVAAAPRIRIQSLKAKTAPIANQPTSASWTASAIQTPNQAPECAPSRTTTSSLYQRRARAPPKPAGKAVRQERTIMLILLRYQIDTN